MSNNNTGNKLKQENNAKFDSNPSTSQRQTSAPVNKSPFVRAKTGGTGHYQEKAAQREAGKSFSQDGIYESPFADDYFNSKYFGFDAGSVLDGDEGVGDSDNFYNLANPHIDYEKIRSDAQSNWGKGLSGFTRFTGKTLTGVVGNSIGMIYGLGEMAMEGELDANKLIDNDLVRNLDELNEDISHANSIFVDPNSGVGFNSKTFAEVVDAYSFVAGMVVTELGMQTIGNLAGGAGILTTPARWGKYIANMGKIMRAGDKTMDAVQTAAKQSMQIGKTVDKLSKAKRASDITKAVTSGALNFGRRAMTTTGYEAGLMGRQVHDELIQEGVAEMEYYLQGADMTAEEKAAYREETMKALEENAKSASMGTFLATTAILGAGAMVQFPKIFGNSFVKYTNLNKIYRSGTGAVRGAKGLKEMSKQVGGAGFRLLKNPATEFMEETLQGVIGNVAKNEYEVMMGTRSAAGVIAPQLNTFGDNLIKGLSDVYGTSEGRHEGIIGAIVGSIGVPGLKKHGKGYKLTANGGIPEAFQDEKARWKNTKSAIQKINSGKLSGALKYNKDKAILNAMDDGMMEIALETDNEMAFESIKDNRTYRYTVDRLDKGLDDHIEQDIKDMEEMIRDDFDKYKKAFQKDEGTTKEEALKEVEDFKKKTEIYKDAYKKVNKRFNENLLKQDDRSRKFVDIVTYAVATEKVQMARRDKMIDELHEQFNGKFTKEELQEFFNTSGRVAKLKKPLEEYVKEKNDARYKDHFEDPKYLRIKKELEEERDQKLAEVAHEEHKDGVNEAYEAKLEAHKEAHEAKFKKKKFQAKKSSTAREMQLDIDAVNNEIEASVSEAMKEISEPQSRLTQAELEAHLQRKQEIIDELNKQHGTSALLDHAERKYNSENAKKLFNDAAEIADRMLTATHIARALYGIKDPMGFAQAYSRIARGELLADLSNAAVLDKQIHSLIMSEDYDPVMVKGLIRELKEIMEDIDKNFEDSLFDIVNHKDGKKRLEKLEDVIESIKKNLERYEKAFEEAEEEVEETKKDIEDDIKQEKKEETIKRNKRNEKKDDPEDPEDTENPEEEDEDDIMDKAINNKLNQEGVSTKGATGKPVKNPDEEGAGDTDSVRSVIDLDDDSSDDSDSGNKSSASNSSTGSTSSSKNTKPGSRAGKRDVSEAVMKNSLSINTKDAFNKYDPNFKKMFEYVGDDGKPAPGFVHKGAVTMEIKSEKDMNPETNLILKKHLIEKGLYKTYEAGRKKIFETEDGKKELAKDIHEMDDDVYNFIRLMPARFHFYDKPLSKKDNYDFDEADLDDPMYTMEHVFDADDIRNMEQMRANKLALYEDKKAKLDKDYEADKKDADAKEKSRLAAQYDHDLRKLDDEFYYGGHNSMSNFNFRFKLLKTAVFTDRNTIKLRTDAVNLGDFEKHNFTVEDSTVQENHVKTIGFKAEDMSIDDIYYYGNGKNEGNNYNRIDGVPISNLPTNPFPNESGVFRAISGAIFFRKTEKSGRSVPIKMNKSKIGTQYAEEILDMIEDYLKHKGKGYKVKNSSFEFLNGKSIDKALEFYMNNQRGKESDMTAVKNTFSVKEVTDENGKIKKEVRLYIGNTQPVILGSLTKYKKLRDIAVKGVARNRFFIKKDFLLQDGKLNKKVLQRLFDEHIINHSFTESNIYAKNPVQGITLSTVDFKGTRTRPKPPAAVNDLVVQLKDMLADRTKKDRRGPNKDIRGVSTENIIFAINKRTLSKFSRKKEELLSDLKKKDPSKARKELTEEEQVALVREAVEEATESRIDSIMKLSKKRPGLIKNKDHDSVFQWQEDDSDFDKMLRLVYAYREAALNKRVNFVSDIVSSSNYKEFSERINTEFGKRSLLTLKSINKYASHNDRKTANVTSLIDTQDKLDNVIAHAEYLREMTRYKTLHVRHADDFINNSRRTANVKDYIPRERGEKAKKYHYATELTKVKINGDPVIKDGKVVGGDIELVFRDLKPNGKVTSTTKKLVVNTEKEFQGEINIITQINLPYSNKDMSGDIDALEQSLKDAEERNRHLKQSIIATTNSVIKLNNGDVADAVAATSPTKGNHPDQVNMLLNDEDGPEAQEPMTDDTDDPETKTTISSSPVSTIDFNDSKLYNQYSLEEFAEVIQTAITYNKAEDRANFDFEIEVSVMEDSFGITTADQVMTLYNEYTKRGLLDKIKSHIGESGIDNETINFDTFVKKAFGETEIKCEA